MSYIFLVKQKIAKSLNMSTKKVLNATEVLVILGKVVFRYQISFIFIILILRGFLAGEMQSVLT